MSYKLNMVKVREFSKSSWWNHTASRGRVGLAIKRFNTEKNTYTFGHALADGRSVMNSVGGALIGAGLAGVATMAAGSPAIAAYMAITAVAAKPVTQTALAATSGAVEAVAPSFWSRTKRWWT